MEERQEKQEEQRPPRRDMEEAVIVLDFLPNGYPSDTRPMHMKTPIVQALGKEHFTLLELVPKKGVFLQPYEEVYIGEGKRDKIHHITGKLNVEKLTSTANSELKYVVKNLVEKNEKRFIDFFNKAQPLTTRMHQLELLPGLGKKHMWEILEERKDKPFESFADLKKRVKLMPDPENAVIKRIINELQGKEKHLIFIRH
jgi:putative nucleotide binding protein